MKAKKYTSLDSRFVNLENMEIACHVGNQTCTLKAVGCTQLLHDVKFKICGKTTQAMSSHL